MNVIINDTSYENVQWDNGSMTIETNMTLSELEEAFTPGKGANIIVLDGTQEIARYYNKGISSMTIIGNSPRTVIVVFNVTQIPANAEEEIRENIEDSDGAIEELASIISELTEYDFNDIVSKLQVHEETISTWFSHASEIGQFINDLRKEGGILDQFNVRIIALEQIIGVGNIEIVNEGDEDNG